MNPHHDPVPQQRTRIARWVRVAQRVGYLLYLGAMVTFFVGMAFGFGLVITRFAIAFLVGGSIVLAPAIVAGYAVKAAVRDDLEHGRDPDR